MATLSSVTSWADRDPLSPSHLNSKLNPLVASLVALNTSSNTVHFNVRDYGATGDGGTDDTAAIRSTMSAAAAAGTRAAAVYFPAGDYVVSSTITLPSGFGNLWFVGDGHYASLIRSSHSRIMFDVQSGGNNGWREIGLVGSGYTYLGARADQNVGVYVRAGSSAIYVVSSTMQSTGSYCVFFEADAGGQSLIADSILVPSFATTTSPRPEAVLGHRGVDTGATAPRMMANIETGGARLFDIQGCKDFFLVNCFAHNISMTSQCQNVFMQGVRLGTEGSVTTITGTTVEMFGGGHAGNIVLDANAVNCTVIASTVSGIVDLATPGSNLVIGGVYGNTGLGFRTTGSQFLGTRSTADSTNSLIPTFAFSSETSLGLYRSEASVIAQSIGALSVPGFRSGITIKVANYTVTKHDQTVSFNSSSTVTATLPAPSTVTGQVFDVQRLGTQPVIVVATSGASLNNNSAMTLSSQFESITFQSYGSGYLAK